MQDVKPWHIVVIVLGVLGLGGSIWWSVRQSGNQVQLADTVTLADVATGELLVAEFPKERAVLYPAKNPQSGGFTLYPVTKDGEKWVIKDRFRPQSSDLEVFKKAARAVTDFSKFEVKVANDTPKKAKVW